MNKKVALLLGTRPEAIKLAPLALKGSKNIQIWNSGQHRDLVRPMLSAFGLEPHLDLGLMQPGQTPASFFSRAVGAISEAIQSERPDWIVVQGDTTTAAAGAVAAFYENIPLAHVEAGLRTYDLRSPWPEEYNRRLIAVSARWHFAPTPMAREHLLNEKIPSEKILVTGNTGIDALLWMVERLRTPGNALEKKWDILDPHRALILCTLHRREAFGEAMRSLMEALAELARTTSAQIILPLHPNPEVRAAAHAAFGTTKPASLLVVDPLEYEEFLWLMDRSTIVVSDSGGVQEEAPTLGKPVVVTRNKTERPEAVAAGAAILAGTHGPDIVGAVRQLLDSAEMYKKMAVPRFLFGNGKAAEQILDALGCSL